MQEIRFVAATGMVGAGVHEPSLQEALALDPHFIAADAGTTDAGPFYLGSGRAALAREAVKRDMDVVLCAARKLGIPALIGSVGTAGSDTHVDWMLEIVREIIAEHGWSLKVATIRSQQDERYLIDLLARGRIRPLDPAPTIDAALLKRSRVVGMMGVEPLQDAIRSGADIVIAGRCSDPALYAAIPIMRGFPAGYAWHAGKTAECGTMVCETSGRGVIFGTITQNELILRPIGNGLRCTPQSVAAHGLYENSDPYLHKECSGTLDLSECVYEQIDETAVRVTGSRFHSAETYTVKLEGAEQIGFQTIMVGGVRDPYILRQLDSWLANVNAYIQTRVVDLLGVTLGDGRHTLNMHVYGRNAVMGALEKETSTIPQEVGIVVEATAPTQAIATSIAKICRQPLLHYPIPEWKGGITGFACLHNPAEIERGPVYRFCLNHVAMPERKDEMFRMQLVQMGESSMEAA